MVDSISNWASGSILKSQTQQTNAAAQQQGRSSFLQATQEAAKAARAVLDQFTQTIDQASTSGNRVLVKPATGSNVQISDAAPINTNLPRGSLVDIVA